ELLRIEPDAVLKVDKEKILSDDHIEIRFVIDRKGKTKLEEVRSLLGPKGAAMTYAELMESMAEISAEVLKQKRFGKKVLTLPIAEVQAQSSAREASKPQNLSQNIRHIPKKTAYLVWRRD